MPAHGSMPAPPNERPYLQMSEPGQEQTVYTVDPAGRVTRLTQRQIGWQGQSGAFYALGEHPSRHEPGSYAPIWVTAHSDDMASEDLIALVARSH
jgi:hypothetical protein